MTSARFAFVLLLAVSAAAPALADDAAPAAPAAGASGAAAGPTKSKIVNGALKVGEAEHKAMQGLAAGIVRKERAMKEKKAERAAEKAAKANAGGAAPAAPAN